MKYDPEWWSHMHAGVSCSAIELANQRGRQAHSGLHVCSGLTSARQVLPPGATKPSCLTSTARRSSWMNDAGKPWRRGNRQMLCWHEPGCVMHPMIAEVAGTETQTHQLSFLQLLPQALQLSLLRRLSLCSQTCTLLCEPAFEALGLLLCLCHLWTMTARDYHAI